MDYATEYVCACGATKWVPERPLDAQARIRTGCEQCDRITPHAPVGTIHATRL